MKTLTRAEYLSRAVVHIALNDDPGETRVSEIQRYVTVALVADVFNVSARTIARAVAAVRREQ